MLPENDNDLEIIDWDSFYEDEPNEELEPGDLADDEPDDDGIDLDDDIDWDALDDDIDWDALYDGGLLQSIDYLECKAEAIYDAKVTSELGF